LLSTTNFAPSDLYTSATNTATAVTAAPVGRTVELGRDRLEGDAFVPEFFQPSDFAVAGEDLVFGAFGITNLSAMAPGLSLAGIRLVIPDHAVGLPVLRTLSLCTCRRHYSGAASEPILRSLTRTYQPSPKGLSGRRIVLFEACSAFAHVAACTLARSPIRDPLSEGFSHSLPP